MAGFLGLMSCGHLLVQALFGNPAADAVHQVFQVLLFPTLAWFVAHMLLNVPLFYQKLILIGTAALMLGFLSAIAQRRLTDDYALLPDMLQCFPTRWGDICTYHLKVGVVLDVLCFSWAITLRQKMLLQKMASPKPLLPDLPAEGDPMLQKLLEYLSQHFQDETLTVRQIAQALHLSTSQLNRKLKKKVDLTTEQYLLRYRLDRAHELLRNTTKPVIVVMREVGMKDPAHFSRAFKKHHGHSPAEIRGHIVQKAV